MANRYVATILMALAIVGCTRKQQHLLNDPADPEGESYVGHEVLPTTDKSNWPSLSILRDTRKMTSADTLKAGVAYTYVAFATDPNPAGLEPGAIVRYEWDFGDGTTYDDGPREVRHTFGAPGRYDIAVEVTDDDGNHIRSAAILTAAEPSPPAAHPGGPYDVLSGEALTLSGRATDLDGGPIVRYEWDFDGDGVFDWSSSESGATSHTYSGVGKTFSARLRVTDDDGNVHEQATIVFVAGPLTTWSTESRLPNPRGGVSLGAVGGKIYSVGGGNRLDIYDPVDRRWTTGAAMPSERSAPVVGTIDGRLYVVGGSGSKALEIYNPSMDRWTSGPPLPTEYRTLAGGVVDGELYVVTGDLKVELLFLFVSHKHVSAMHIYNPATNSWRRGPSMPTPRISFTAAAMDGRLYVMGGKGWPGETLFSLLVGDVGCGYTEPPHLATVESYDPATGRWTGRPDLGQRRHGAGAAAARDHLYVVGGFGSLHGWADYCTYSARSGMEVYRSGASSWSDQSSPLAGGVSATSSGGRLFCTDGSYMSVFGW